MLDDTLSLNEFDCTSLQAVGCEGIVSSGWLLIRPLTHISHDPTDILLLSAEITVNLPQVP